jgi:pathogenesis-related protein 1
MRSLAVSLLPVVLLVAACGPSRLARGRSHSGASEPVHEPIGLRSDDASRAPAPPPAPTEPAAAPPAPGSSEADILLAEHNRVRARHCAPPLGWSPSLARVAQRWAEHLRDKGCVLEHSQGTGYGENLAAGTSSIMSPSKVVDMWASEVGVYDFSRPGFSMQAGHFTQVVWKGTSFVGCGKASCPSMDIWVCNYDPPGNVTGDFPANVQPTGCR